MLRNITCYCCYPSPQPRSVCALHAMPVQSKFQEWNYSGSCWECKCLLLLFSQFKKDITSHHIHTLFIFGFVLLLAWTCATAHLLVWLPAFCSSLIQPEAIMVKCRSNQIVFTDLWFFMISIALKTFSFPWVNSSEWKCSAFFPVCAGCQGGEKEQSINPSNFALFVVMTTAVSPLLH